MSWLDPVFGILIGIAVAYGARRGAIGALVGLGAVAALRPILGLTPDAPLLTLAAMGLGGLLLGAIGRTMLGATRRSRGLLTIAGAAGGAALGVVLVVTIAISLPIQRSPFDPSQLYYPPRDLPTFVQGAVRDSYVIQVGRDVLLFPLLDPHGQVPEARRELVQTLHRWLVIGEPWRTGGAGS